MVFGVGKHSENLEDFVIYKSLYDIDTGFDYWVRPVGNFIEEIEKDGKKIRRFDYIGDFGNEDN